MSLLHPVERVQPPAGRPLIKICGVTRPRDAELAVALGADLVGLNFHPPSPRSLEPAAAEEIAATVRGRARLVGVFVHLSRDEIATLDRRLGLDLVQLHGDQRPEEVAAWGERAIKVVRVDRETPPTAAEIDRELARHPAAWGFLFDVRHPAWGGSGESFAWSVLAGVDRGTLGGRPLLVAGGVTPDNAVRALEESGADGVDVASGVESGPGVKSDERLRRLFTEVRPDGQSEERRHPGHP